MFIMCRQKSSSDLYFVSVYYGSRYPLPGTLNLSIYKTPSCRSSNNKDCLVTIDEHIRCLNCLLPRLNSSADTVLLNLFHFQQSVKEASSVVLLNNPKFLIMIPQYMQALLLAALTRAGGTSGVLLWLWEAWFGVI